MSRLAEYEKKLYWICEECGNEVEYNEKEKNVLCPSCGMPASEETIREAEKTLDMYLSEKARTEKEEKIRQLKIYKAEQAVKRVQLATKTIHYIPYLLMFILVAALALTAVSIAVQEKNINTVWSGIISIFKDNSALRHIRTSLNTFIQTKQYNLERSVDLFGENTVMLIYAFRDTVLQLGDNLPTLLSKSEHLLGRMKLNIGTFLKNAVRNILDVGEKALDMIER